MSTPLTAAGGDGPPDEPGGPGRLAESLDRVVAGLADDRRPRRAGPGGGRAGPSGRAGPGAGGMAGASGLFARWEELVGPAVAAHARPVRVQEGRLVVATDDPAWASQLRWLEAELLGRIAGAGGPRLDGLVVRVRRR